MRVGVVSFIRKEKYRPATTTPAALYVTLMGPSPPWILKWDGLESSGEIIISSRSKTKRKAFFCVIFFFFFSSY